MSDTVAWLRDRTDEQLVALLQARPDLAVPLPTDLTVLARRADAPHSVWRVLEGCTEFEVALLQALLVVPQPRGPVTTEDVARELELDPAVAVAGLEGLESRALARRGPTGWVAGPGVASAFGDHPAGVGPAGPLDQAGAAAALAAVDPTDRELLERLTRGRPRGSVGPSASAAVARLVEAGLLLPQEAGTVVLTREAGVALRGRLLPPARPEPPVAELRTPGVETVDRTAADRALAVVGAARALATRLRREPVAELRSGGIGVLPTRRLARESGLAATELALLLELLAADGTLGVRSEGQTTVWAARPVTSSSADEDGDGSVAEDDTDPVERWASLVSTWWQLRRDPSRAGTKDEAGKARAVLSAELHWHRGPADRRFLFGALAELPPGSALDAADLQERLAWTAPLRDPQRRDAAAATVLAEATWLGLVAFDSLTSAGREPLAGRDPAPAVRAALPPPVDTLLVQADLTVLVPGRPSPELLRVLDDLADLESSGGATVHRVTAESLRRGLDRGLDPAMMHRFFAEHSATPIPQGLTYLIDDVAARHGSLRIGPASAVLRSDDTGLLDAAVARAQAAGLTVRRLAPTVAITTADPARLLAALDGDGLLPVLEDATGAVVDPSTQAVPDATEPRPVRRRQPPVEPPTPDPDQLLTLIRRLRQVEIRAPEGDPADMAAILRAAAEDRSPVWIGYVESDGRAHTRLIEPIAVSGGAVAALDRLRGAMRSFALHRVTRVEPAQDGDVPS